MAESSQKRKEPVATNRVHHPEYYFEEGTIFLVQNTYFKVPRRKLCLLSPVFKDLFALDSESDLEGKGSSDENPLHIPSLSAIDFERLLTYVYPLAPHYADFTKEWSFEYWRSILLVAHRFLMEDIRTHAIKETEKSSFPDPLNKIHHGHKFEHPQWVHQGYIELLQRPNQLSIEEAQRLGFENAFCCMAARENYRSGSYDPYQALNIWFTGKMKLPGKLPPDQHTANTASAIDRIF